jgi:hypothetical protein
MHLGFANTLNLVSTVTLSGALVSLGCKFDSCAVHLISQGRRLCDRAGVAI